LFQDNLNSMKSAERLRGNGHTNLCQAVYLK
jgi:hypothetical protein